MSKPLALLSCAAVLLVTSAGCGQQSSSEQKAGGQVATCSYPSAGSPVNPVDPPSTDDVPGTGTAAVTLKLDGKPVTITLDRAGAPCASHSLESLAKQGWFTDTTCHRLTDQGIFVLQCGDPSGTGSGGPGYTFADELGTANELPSAGTAPDGTALVNYTRGTVAMANAGPDTNGSQIFLVWQDSTLPAAYTVLGRMDDKSLQAVGEVAAQGVAADGRSPNAPAKITDVTLG